MRYECGVCCNEDYLEPCVLLSPSADPGPPIGCPWGLDDEAAWVKADARPTTVKGEKETIVTASDDPNEPCG